LPGPLITAELAPDNLLQSYAANRNRTDQDIWGASIVVTRDSGDSSLKFIGAYRGLRSHVATDDDGFYYQLEGNDLRVRQSQFSGELQYNGVAGRLAYTAGLNAFTEMPRLLPTRPQPDIFYTCGCLSPDFLDPLESETRRIRTLSYAGYAQASVKLGERLSATVGARLTRELKTLDGATYAVNADLRPTGPTLREGHAKDAWNSFTFRAGVEYQATADFMAFGSVARGFKSGGFNVRGQANLPNMGFAPFDPETALTFEIGLRSEWLRRRLRVNATMFDTEYKNIQLRQLTEVGEIFTTLIENAARARITGAEFELAAVPFDGLTVTAAYGHLKPTYLDVGNVLDLTLHSRFQRTPRNSFTASLNYAAALPVGTLEGQIDYSFRSKEQFQILAAINDQAAYALIGARVTFRAPRDRWNVSLFSTNLADRRYRTAGRGTLVEHAGFAYSSIGLPRQVGIELSTAF
ncbi:MAG: TonB-dependent receptor, partial [Vicinamibacterales bacterium]